MTLDKVIQYLPLENSKNIQEAVSKQDNKNNFDILNNRDPNFKETLQNISTHEDKKNKPLNDKDLRKKIENIKDKIKELEKNPEVAENISIENIKAIIDKISALMEKSNKKNEKMQLDFGKVSIDLTSFFNEILNKITDMLNKSFRNQKSFDNLLSLINKKLNDINAIELEKDNLQTVKTGTFQKDLKNQERNMNNQTEQKNETESNQEKVKIIDKRSFQYEETSSKVKTEKETKVLSSEKSTNKQFADIKKAEPALEKNNTINSIQKIIDKNEGESLKKREDIIINTKQFDQNFGIQGSGLPAKQYASYA